MNSSHLKKIINLSSHISIKERTLIHLKFTLVLGLLKTKQTRHKMDIYTGLKLTHAATQITIFLLIAYDFYTRGIIVKGKYDTQISRISALAFRATIGSLLVLYTFKVMTPIILQLQI